MIERLADILDAATSDVHRARRLADLTATGAKVAAGGWSLARLWRAGVTVAELAAPRRPKRTP